MAAELETDDGGAGPQVPDRTWGMLLATIVGAELTLQLDGTIVNVSLPSIQTALGLSVQGASWVPNGFLLAFGALLLFSGRLGDVIGPRRMFVAGIGLVVVGSAVAGLAPSAAVLIAGRVVQGLGAALAGPAGLSLLTVVFTGDRQARAFGLYSTVSGFGAAGGMVLGGLLTELGGWRWSLLVNVPVGLALLAVALRSLRLRDDVIRGRSLALPSAALATTALLALVYGLVSAAERGWGSPTTVGVLVAAVVLAAVLLVADRRAPEPLLPGRVFADRRRVASFLGLLLLASVLTGFLIYLVQYLQFALGLDPLRAGLAILPFGLAVLLATRPVGPVGSLRLETRGVIGFVGVLAGVVWLSALEPGSSYLGGVLGPIIVLGLGVGLAIVPLTMTILTTSHPEDTGVTAGLVQVSLTAGGATGVALLLVPYTSGTGDPATTIGTLFVWCSIIILAALVIVAAGWWLPRRRMPGRRSECAGVRD